MARSASTQRIWYSCLPESTDIWPTARQMGCLFVRSGLTWPGIDAVPFGVGSRRPILADGSGVGGRGYPFEPATLESIGRIRLSAAGLKVHPPHPLGDEPLAGFPGMLRVYANLCHCPSLSYTLTVATSPAAICALRDWVL